MSAAQPVKPWRVRLNLAAVLALTVFLGAGNVRLYSRPRANLRTQLDYLGSALRHGAGEKMQAVFPEGYLFTHVLYGLALVQSAESLPPGDPRRGGAAEEARWVVGRLDSPAALEPRAAKRDPPYGVFHAGWSAWLRGSLLRLDSAAERDRFEADCAVLAHAFERSKTPFLESYPVCAWPVDSVVAVAALRLHDQLLPPRYGKLIQRWLDQSAKLRDPATGLLPHRVEAGDGSLLQGTRGSSQSLLLPFLSAIDPALGAEQYDRFRAQFAASALGGAGVREYPIGVAGEGDVDSLPLVLGLSPVASVVSIAAARQNGDRALDSPLEAECETFLLPVNLLGRKCYGLGRLPVLDAFLAWSRAFPLAAERSFPPVARPWWRWPWHLLSAAVLGLAWRSWRRLRSRAAAPPALQAPLPSASD